MVKTYEYDYFKQHLQEFESMMCIKLGDVLLLDVTSAFHLTPKFSYSSRFHVNVRKKTIKIMLTFVHKINLSTSVAFI